MEINERLAKWVFPTCEVESLDYKEGQMRLSNRGLTVPDECFKEGVAPHFWSVDLFTQSLDACVKWLVPKLTTRCIDPEIAYDHEIDQWVITLHR